MQKYKVVNVKKIPETKVKRFEKLTKNQRNAKPTSNEKYQWASLEVGQAVNITSDISTPSMQRAKRYAQRKYGRSFLVEPTNKGFRILRVA